MGFSKSILVCLLLSTIAFSAFGREESKSSFFTSLFSSGGLTRDDKEPDMYDHVTLYATNFLQGAKVIKTIPDTVECVNATRDTARIIGKSVEKIMEKGLSFETYLAHTEAISTAQPTVETCFKPNYEQIKKSGSWFKNFNGPVSFVEKFFFNGAYSFYHWMEISKAFMQALTEADYPRMSYIGGRATFVLFDFDNDQMEARRRGLRQEEMRQNVLSSLFGFIYNFMDGSHIFEPQKVAACEATFTDYRKTFAHASELIDEGTDESIEEGFFIIAGLVGEYSNLNKVCSDGVISGIDRVKDYMRIQNKPFEIVFNFFWNHRKIYHHLIQTLDCTFAGDAQCIGLNLGGLFYEIFAKH